VVLHWKFTEKMNFLDREKTRYYTPTFGFRFVCVRRTENIRANSSAGRAPALQAGGHRFEPCFAHQRAAGPGTNLRWVIGAFGPVRRRVNYHIE
jgi:hypothetical protein